MLSIHTIHLSLIYVVKWLSDEAVTLVPKNLIMNYKTSQINTILDPGDTIFLHQSQLSYRNDALWGPADCSEWHGARHRSELMRGGCVRQCSILDGSVPWYKNKRTWLTLFPIYSFSLCVVFIRSTIDEKRCLLLWVTSQEALPSYPMKWVPHAVSLHIVFCLILRILVLKLGLISGSRVR